MDLDRELSMLKDETESVVEVNNTTQTAVAPATNYQQEVVQTSITQPVTTQVAYNQPAMVNPTASQNMVNGFNFANIDVGYNEVKSYVNPIQRLTGTALNESFRVHFLPGFGAKEIRTHWDEERRVNFICLSQAYGTGERDVCCDTHGYSKIKEIIPVIVYPSVNPGANPLRGELKALVIGNSTYKTLMQQVENSGTTFTNCDIICTVSSNKDLKFKTFTYAVNPNTLVNQVSNLEDLKREWGNISTPENVFRLMGRLITREDYNNSYSSYDFSKYQNKDNQQNQTQQPMYQQPPMNYQQPMYQQPPVNYQQPTMNYQQPAGYQPNTPYQQPGVYAPQDMGVNPSDVYNY